MGAKDDQYMHEIDRLENERDSWQRRAKKLEAEMTLRGSRCLELNTEVESLRASLHRIAATGAKAIADTWEEGADRYKGDELTRCYAALVKMANEARTMLGLPAESGE